MPEGHTIRRLGNKWEELVGENLLLTSPQGRFNSEAQELTGSKLVGVSTHGKHLFLEFSEKRFIHVHLGLYGRMRWHRAAPFPEASLNCRMRVLYSEGVIDLSGPTRCALITSGEKAAVHARLGVDPLDPAATVAPLLPWAATSAWPIGRTVLDQRRIAGIGNGYRADILFMLAMDPKRETRSLTVEEWACLWLLTRQLLEAGVQHSGGITTTLPGLPRPLTFPLGKQYREATYVYGRAGAPCPSCATPIQAEELAGRRLFWCPTCQAPKPHTS